MNDINAEYLDRIDDACAEAAKAYQAPYCTVEGQPVPNILVPAATALTFARNGEPADLIVRPLTHHDEFALIGTLTNPTPRPVAVDALHPTMQALAIAACAHNGQTRKHGTTPYIAHPLAVALHLASCGRYSEHCLNAALLHDVVEDTDWTRERLANALGPAGTPTLALVDFATEPDKSMSWRSRKEAIVAKLRDATSEQHALFIADKGHNLRALLRESRSIPDGVLPGMRAGRSDQSWFAHALARTIFRHGREQAEPFASFIATVNDGTANGLLDAPASE